MYESNTKSGKLFIYVPTLIAFAPSYSKH
jgi:hypothetical protein